MQVGQGSTDGGSTPFWVQFVNSMQSSRSGSQDHQLHSLLLPQNLWQPSTSSTNLKSIEYSYVVVILNKWISFIEVSMCMITDLALPIHVALSPLGYVKLPIRPFEISVQFDHRSPRSLQEGGLIGAFRYFWTIKETVCLVWHSKLGNLLQNYSSSAYHRCWTQSQSWKGKSAESQ